MEDRPVFAGCPEFRYRSAVIFGLLGLFFVIDLAFPTGVASGVPYVLPVLLALRLRDRRGPLFVAGIATLLTLLGFFLPLPEATSATYHVGIANRMIATVAIWVTAGLGYLWLLRESVVCDREMRLRTLVDSTPDLILSVDAAGRIESANTAAARAFACSASALAGRQLTDLLQSPASPSDGSIVADASLLIAHGRSGTGLAMITAGETPRTIRWTVRQLDELGQRLVVGHDLTDLLSAQERAVRSERLAAIGQTLATLSHEAKNELLGLRFGLEQLSNCWEDREATSDLIEEMLESQGRLWTLFEDVRGYAAPIRLKTSRVRLHEVWRRAWQSLESKGSNRFSLLEDFQSDGIECVVDAFRIEQVFRNLFENAFAACGDAVRIQVSCQAGTWRGEQALFVTVRDNGPGVPEDVRDRLFEPFFTTKAHGTGLGLPLSRRVIEAHHGELALASVGTGAAFTITLPCKTCNLQTAPTETVDTERRFSHA